MSNKTEKENAEKRIYHFGVYLKNSSKLRISRENYAIVDNRNTAGNELYAQLCMPPEKRKKIYADDACTTYTDEWCQKHREDCLMNFDLNMKYMQELSSEKFEEALNAFLLKNKKFIQVFDLNECEGKSGVYMLVLDQYKQCYIGQSVSIKKRVMAHWNKTKQFDRLIWGRVENSILSVDSFGALDTTRIFVLYTNDLMRAERRLVNSMPSEYCLNRIGGGIGEDDDYKFEIKTTAQSRALREQ